jgi:glycolate oxidase FAD binding subunit
MTTLQPQTPAEAAEAIRQALVEETPLALRAGGTKARLGRCVDAKATLDLSRLSGVTLYEPEELVISLRPGTPRAEVEALLAESGQMLAFEPPDFGPLLGGDADQDSLGGAIAINAAGPRRLKAGAARDFVLGVKGVSGFGEAFKSGGRVVKNVSGYDLGKLVAGSFGTLAAMTEVTLKVLPEPDAETTLVLLGLDAPTACAALRKAAAHPAEGAAFAYLPAAVAALAPTPGVEAAAVIRLEGASASLAARADALLKDMPRTPVARLHGEESRLVWRAVRDVAPLAPPTELPLWRISVPPTDGPAILAAAQGFAFADWAGGLIWMASETPPEIRSGARMLVRAPEEQRAALPFLASPDDGLFRLIDRVKASFDPKRILNPGRMYEGV